LKSDIFYRIICSLAISLILLATNPVIIVYTMTYDRFCHFEKIFLKIKKSGRNSLPGSGKSEFFNE